MRFCYISKIPKMLPGPKRTIANKRMRSRLWMLAEKLSVPTKELVGICRENLKMDIDDIARISPTQNTRLRKWLRKNEVELGEKYRCLMWAEGIDKGEK